MRYKYQELMQDIINMPHEGRVLLGKEALNDSIQVLLKNGIDTDKISVFITALIKLFVSADTSCDYEELQLIRDILEEDISEEDFYEKTNGGRDPEFVQTFYSLINDFTPDEKIPFCILGLCILASDEELTVEEQKLFIILSE